jgi:hypothetical protein
MLMIPLFACKSLDTTLGFYEALGFETTYRQEKPYLYGAVNKGDIHLNFANHQKEATCLVILPDIALHYRTFADALREKFGKIPTAGLPRITRLQPGQTRFSIFDPEGNTLLFIADDEPDIDYDAYDDTLSPLRQALVNAAFVRDTYTDDASAAKFLDRKLSQLKTATPIDRALALAMRAEIAIAMGDDERARIVRAELMQIPLSDVERDQYKVDLEASDRLEKWLTQKVNS